MNERTNEGKDFSVALIARSSFRDLAGKSYESEGRHLSDVTNRGDPKVLGQHPGYRD